MAQNSETQADLLAEVNEVDGEESAAMLAEQTPSTSAEYIEYLGDPANPHGTDFVTSHTILKGDPTWKRLGVEVKKDLTWERDPLGPAVGFKGNRMLLPVSDLPAGVAEAIVKMPEFKRVTVE